LGGFSPANATLKYDEARQQIAQQVRNAAAQQDALTHREAVSREEAGPSADSDDVPHRHHQARAARPGLLSVHAYRSNYLLPAERAQRPALSENSRTHWGQGSTSNKSPGRLIVLRGRRSSARRFSKRLNATLAAAHDVIPRTHPLDPQ
jgi:hypothetical protein